MNTILQIQSDLLSDDEETRRSALQELNTLPLEVAREMIFLALGDSSWRVRKEGVEALVRFSPDQNTVEALLQLLRSGDNAGLRNSAAEALIRWGYASTEALIGMIQDDDAEVRKFIIDVMGAIGDRLFVPHLLNALNDPVLNVAAAAAEQLGAIGDDSAVPELIAAIISRNEDLFRFSALRTLSTLAKPGPVPDEIIKLAEYDILRKAVFDCLGTISDQSSLPILMSGLSSRQNSCRAAAVKALAKLFNRSDSVVQTEMRSVVRTCAGSETVAALLELFSSDDQNLTEGLIWFCTVTQDPRCIPKLVTAAALERCTDPVLAALKSFGSEGIADCVASFSELADNERSALCRLIGEGGYSCYSDIVLTALQDPAASVRKTAAAVAGTFGMITALPLLERLLDDTVSDVRAAALAGLKALAMLDRSSLKASAYRLCTSQTIYHRSAAAALLAVLGERERLLLLVKDENPQVRKAAVSSVGLLHDGIPAAFLAIALADEDAEVRCAVAELLGTSTERPRALSALEQALNDEDIWVQCTVLQSIARLDAARAVSVICSIFERSEGMLMITCLKILGTIGGTEALKLISSVTGSTDPDIARQAAAALDIISGKRSSSSGLA